MKIQMNPTQKTVETDKNPFHLSLSISTKTVKTKNEGKPLTKFFLKEKIPVNETELTPFLTKHLHSTNLWYKKNTDIGTSNQDNYSGITGILVDYDDTVPMNEFKVLFSKYHFVLYPSTHHGQKDDSGKVMEKYHVIFPIDPNDYDQYINAD
jgi:hypothetical protein